MRRFLLLLSAGALACGDGPAAESDPVFELAGSWTIQAWELRSVANPSLKMDLIAEGLGGTMVIAANGAFTIEVTSGGDPTSTQTGTLTIHADTVVFHGADGDFRFQYSRAGDAMTWLGLDIQVLDLDDDGSPDQAIEYLVFRRN
jgi:hypothetical protein